MSRQVETGLRSAHRSVPSPPCDDRTRRTGSARSSTISTPTRRCRSITPIPTRCSSRWRSRRRPPTRRSTRSRRRCSPSRTRRRRWPRSTPTYPVRYIREVGLAPTKARNLHTAANQIVDAGGEVIADWDFLESLAGVGHKTASVVMAQAFGVPAFAGRHPHPPARRTLGPVRRVDRREDRTRPQVGASRARRGTPATCRSSTSAASTARRCGTT